MTNPGPIVQNFLDRLDGVRQSGGNFMARCPCRNDDNNPSLSVSEGTDGRVLVHCHRGNGCDASEICASVGLTISDIMPQNGTSTIYEKPIVKKEIIMLLENIVQPLLSVLRISNLGKKIEFFGY